MLTNRDCMNFSQWYGHEGVDMFPLDITVTSKLNDVPDNVGIRMTVADQDIRLKVFFIYTGYNLSGKLFDVRFGFS